MKNYLFIYLFKKDKTPHRRFEFGKKKKKKYQNTLILYYKLTNIIIAIVIITKVHF